MVPSSLQSAAVAPILKKPTILITIVLFLISNLFPFLSKILEKTVASQVHTHLSYNNFYEQCQSGFCHLNSTETSLIKITNNLLMAADSRLLTILILLALTAAIWKMSHTILINRVSSLESLTHPWTVSSQILWPYWAFSVKKHSHLPYSLSPLVFPKALFMAPFYLSSTILPLGHICRRYNIHFHCYMAHTQLYMSTILISTLPPTSLSACLQETRSWFFHNFIKLNNNKTEILLIGTKSSLSKINIYFFPISTDNSWELLTTFGSQLCHILSAPLLLPPVWSTWQIPSAPRPLECSSTTL